MNRSSILITGGGGFIGSHLADCLLKTGHKIICIDNFDPFYAEEIKLKNIKSALMSQRFRLLEIDIRDVQKLEMCFNANEIDLVIHLAAKAGIRPSIADPKEYYDVNVIGTLNLLEAMRKYDVKKMIFASSSSVYGINSRKMFSETDNVDFPISPYAATKKAGELLCNTYHHLYDFDIFCLRFFTVYGARQRPDLAIHKFTDRILNNQPIDIYGDGTSSRDYTYIDDIINGIVFSIEKLKGYEIINLGESRTISLNKMVETLEKYLKRKAIKNLLPLQHGDVISTCADILKAKELLGYSPKWKFEDGIQEFIKWKLQ